MERSNDNGKTYKPWHYFASSPSECRSYFGVDPYLGIQDDDTVLCSTEYSQIPPFKDGEVRLSCKWVKWIQTRIKAYLKGVNTGADGLGFVLHFFTLYIAIAATWKYKSGLCLCHKVNV